MKPFYIEVCGSAGFPRFNARIDGETFKGAFECAEILMAEWQKTTRENLRITCIQDEHHPRLDRR